MKSLVAKYVELFVFVLAAIWFAKQPDWEPAIVAITALAAFLASDLRLTFERDPNSVKAIYPQSSDFQQRLLELIESTSYSIVLCGIHFNISLSDRRAAYLDALRRGVDVTIAVLNPQSSEVGASAAVFGMKAAELKSECETSVQVLTSLKADYAQLSPPQGGKLGTLQILLLAECPRCRYYLFDPKAKSGTVVFIPSIKGFRSSHSPAFELDAAAPASKKYIDSCNRVTGAGVVF